MGLAYQSYSSNGYQLIGLAENYAGVVKFGNTVFTKLWNNFVKSLEIKLTQLQHFIEYICQYH